MTKKNRNKAMLWTAEITLLTFFLSMAFNLISQTLVGGAGLVGALFVLFAIILIGVIFDMIGTAAASADLAPFNAKASRRVKGAKKAVGLVKNASRVSSICCDVIGDICGVISGATVAVIIVKIAGIYSLSNTVMISMILSGIVAALTVGGKAFAKHISIEKSTEIISRTALILDFFSFKGSKNGKKRKN